MLCMCVTQPYLTPTTLKPVVLGIIVVQVEAVAWTGFGNWKVKSKGLEVMGDYLALQRVWIG